MPGVESDADFSPGPGIGNRKTDSSFRSGATTPNRSKRINLGTPGNYYFKYLNSGKTNQNNISMFSKDGDEGDTGTISIPGLKLDTENSKADTSFFSIAGSSTASESSNDLLNKSTLSDTTELTASNFVLVTTSKQSMIRKGRKSFAQAGDKENTLNKNDRGLLDTSPPLNRAEVVFAKNQKKVDDQDQVSDFAEKRDELRLERDNTEEVHRFRQQKTSVRSASPSLRSRISSSPASLRKFHENLKNSRLKRQTQREEDTKRRLSTEGTETLDSMHAQLEALTGDGLLRRERLPPHFTQPPKQSPSQAPSSPDETATIEMAALDELLGMKDSTNTSIESESDAIMEDQEVLNNEKSPKIVSNKEQKSTSLSQAEYKPDETENRSPPTRSSFREDQTPKSNSRKRMTPTKLSSTPKRVVNPESLFSPARNTRSATKKRKLSEQQANLRVTEHVVKSKKHSPQYGTTLLRRESLSDNDTSMNSKVTDTLVEVQHDQSDGEMSPRNDDDTASLGDIANLFGAYKTLDDSSQFDTSSVGDDASERGHRESEGQETASIGDIENIINGGFQVPETLTTVEKDTSIDAKDSEMPHQSTRIGDTNDSHLLDNSNSSSVQKGGNDTSSYERNENISDVAASTSLKDASSEPLVDSIPLQKSPDLHKISIQRSLSPGSLDRSSHLTKVVPKSPIRMGRNKSPKPTPTKLAPSPRRVLNPNNPNSPARNTRSSSKAKRKSSGLEGSTKDFSSFTEPNSKIEVDKVLFSSNPRRSLDAKYSVSRMEGSLSPIENRYQKPPVGILSSKKKLFPRRSVAFGSPEAAEYNIGSPSVSLTPMPKGRAKALFTLPEKRSSSDEVDLGQKGTVANDHAGVKMGMDLLVDRITVEQMNDSPELSPIMKSKNDADAYQASPGIIAPKGVPSHEEEEVQLEGGMENLASNNLKRSNETESLSQTEMRDSSVDLTDSESIASINSKCNKYTSDFVVPLHAQRLDFSIASEISENANSMVEDEENQKVGKTVELEGNMLSLLEATKDAKERAGSEKSDDMDISRDSSSLVLKDNGTEAEHFTGNFGSAIKKSGTEADKTVELEGNMLSLLEATKDARDSKDTDLSDKADNIDITRDSLSLVPKDNGTEAEHFTGNFGSAIKKSGTEFDSTVELEGNMLSLLEATKDDKDTEGSNQTDSIDITRDSLPKDNGMEAEHFTGNFGSAIKKSGTEFDSTVELEGNMLSLLEATNGAKDTEGSDNADNMVITRDSLPLVLKENGTEAEHFTGNFGSAFTKIGTRLDKTVELEGNMQSLLEATNGVKETERSDEADDREITADPLSLVSKDNGTEAEHFTGNFGSAIKKSGTELDKTVELEGNMLSLLEGTNGAKDTEGSDEANNMDITGDSSSRFTGNFFGTNTNTVTAGIELDSMSPKDVESNRSKEIRNSTVGMEMSMESGSISESITEEEVMHSPKTEADEVLVVGSNRLTKVSGSSSKPISVDNGENISKEASESLTHKKSLSSNRFFLHQVDQVQNLVDDITAKHQSLVIDKSVSFSDTAEFITTFSTNSESMDKPKILDVSVFTSILFEGLKCKEEDGDILSNSFSRFGKGDNNVARIVFERWGQFVEAVCGEVERRIDQEGTAVSSLAGIVDQDPKYYSMLQERFQSSEDGDQIKTSLNSLVQAGQTLIEYEWNSWLATVLESFHGPLTDTQKIYADDETKLEEALQHIGNLQTNMSLFNDMETNLVRKKSILRYKAVATEVERDIEDIESQLAAIKSDLLELEQEETHLSKATRKHQELLHNAKLHNDLRVKAESSQKNFASLTGLHSWSMRRKSENDLEFTTIGSCSHTHLKLLYEGVESGKAMKNLSSKVDSSCSQSKLLHVYHEPVSGFLDTSTKRLIDMAEQSFAKGSIRIGEHLQKYTWQIGRLDLIAREFQVLQRRHNGVLHRKSADIFSFSVEFENEHSTVAAHFQVEPTYPSIPIEVRLDLLSGEQDLEKIKKSLVKNATPGFGSLSRACDIIQSIIRGSKK